MKIEELLLFSTDMHEGEVAEQRGCQSSGNRWVCDALLTDTSATGTSTATSSHPLFLVPKLFPTD